VKEKNIEVEWKAFELRPLEEEVPPLSEEYVARAKAGVQSLAQQYGLKMDWNDKSKHSRNALQGAKFAKEYGVENEYHEAVFKAQFQELKDINSMETLLAIAAALGLNEAKFREAIETKKYEQQVLQDHQEARSLGITGIPCFISGNKGIMGAQSYEALLNLIETA
jgi:predicted DsbA family dithiol-disulfide isomerase